MKHGKVNKSVLHGWIETFHIFRHFDLTRCVGNYIPYIPHFSKYGTRALIGENWQWLWRHGYDFARDRERPRTSENQATPCKVIEHSLGSWIPRIGFRIPCQEFDLDSGFQSLAGFRIPWAEFRFPKPLSGIYKQKFLGFRIAKQYFLDSGVRLTLNEAICLFPFRNF